MQRRRRHERSADTRAVRRALADARKSLADGPLLVGASGGLDSTVLCHALCEIAELRPLLTLGHVNHKLRGAASELDERFARELAQKLGLPLQVAEVDPETLRLTLRGRARPSPEEAARELRRAALQEMAEARGARLVLAHHANDQAETLLLRLFRGTSPDGLAGMAPVSAEGCILRPLIGVSRRDIEAFARALGLGWREDASNADERFTRNRLRARWLPGLERAFNPQLLRALVNFAEAQRTDRDFFSQLVDDAYGRIVRRDESGDFWVSGAGFRALHDAVAMRLVARIFADAGIGRETSRRHLQRARRFLVEGAGGREIEFPMGWRLSRQGALFRFHCAPVFTSSEC